jgi:hypothetical protein
MSADHDDRTTGQKILEEIAAIPAILAFPPEIFTQLDELCELRGFTHHQLVVEAALSLQGQGRSEKIMEEVLTPLEPGETEVWPEDPLDILARVVALYAMRLFGKSFFDPVGYEEEKKHAPAEWSFCSAKDLDEDDPADWWKTP